MISALCASRFFRLWWKTSQKTRKRRRSNRRKHVTCGHSRQRNSGSLGETLEGKGGGFLSTPLNLKSRKSYGAYWGIRNKFAKDMANLDEKNTYWYFLYLFVMEILDVVKCQWLNLAMALGLVRDDWTDGHQLDCSKACPQFFGLFYFPLCLWLSKKRAPLVNILCFCCHSSVYLCFFVGSCFS